jgi:enterochelin esterase-like enzyme
VTRLSRFALAVAGALALAACDPLAPFPTPTALVIIVTPEASATPPPTSTPPPSATPTDIPTAAPTPTATPDPCISEPGQLIPYDQFESAVADEQIRYRVYVPPCYVQLQRRYPVVYLLPGLRQDETTWGAVGVVEALEQGIRLGSLSPMILVMPELGSIGIADSFVPDASYEQVMLEEIVPAVERDFCVITNREHRAIGGISRGGFWAYSIALRHPDVFGIVGGHSAYLDAEQAPEAVSPLALASDDAFLPEANLRMYLDNAAADPAGATLELFSSRLAARGIAHNYNIYPDGGHDEAYWSAHVSEYLSFYGDDWPRNALNLPSCMEPSP